jgi:hypothetical protein
MRPQHKRAVAGCSPSCKEKFLTKPKEGNLKVKEVKNAHKVIIRFVVSRRIIIF